MGSTVSPVEMTDAPLSKEVSQLPELTAEQMSVAKGIRAAELHYPRIPRPYWEHRIKMCKALGMNAVCMYVFWNIHEQQEGVFDFSGQNDIAAFVRLCQKHGMKVIVRPGPYVCAEWEMGGLPWWLLKKRDIKLREEDPYFLERVKLFEEKVGEQLAPLTADKGGPIIMVQVENEYGSYGQNKPYVSRVRDILRKVGFDKVLLFQCDWSTNFELNALPDLLWTMNFGTNADVLKQFKRLKELRPESPMMCSEYWSGWFDGWGTEHQTRPSTAMVNGIRTMLENDISFSLYMTHGGTSFAQWAGANNKGYAPDCTSYDYDAPINEQGAPTAKYYELRNLLQQFSSTKLPAVPKAIPVITLPAISFTEMTPLLRAGNVPEARKCRDIQPMELFDQGYGSIMYSTTLPAVKAGTVLSISNLCDYGIIYIDGEEAGRLYRRDNGGSALRIERDVKEGATLDIFVEAMGRINYSKLINDPKGITGSVTLLTTSGKDELTYNLKDWEVRLFPLTIDGIDALSSIPVTAPQSDKGTALSASERQMSTPAYYRSSFNVKKIGDTYLDMSSWGKGLVWVNGHCLGRFWEVGPQQTLYLPGCWLKKGKNEIVVLDLIGPAAEAFTSAKGAVAKCPVIRGVASPINDLLRKDRLPRVMKNLPAPAKRTATPAGPQQANDAAPGAK
ncbi:MAG: beta-galactosidase [Prevotella sp.]|nr:beta-galactosidase [Prevotella sp.]